MKIHLNHRLFVALIGQSWAYQDIQLNQVTLQNGVSQNKVVVAVIDTGIDTKGIDWKSQLWVNEGEVGKDSLGRNKSQNNVDDDGNGFIDDVHGWDFVSGKPIKSDDHGHGTHVAGIIHFISPQARIMALRYYGSQLAPEKTIEYTALAIRYAVKMGAQVINYSGGGASSSPIERQALDWADSKNVLVVAAAGNSGSNNDRDPYFPASYELSNIISVAAYGVKGLRIPSSNYGTYSVDLSAPGEEVLSSLPRNQMGTMTGTSQATAVTSGAIALWLSQQHSPRTPFQISEHLRESSIQKDPMQLNPLEKPKINLPRLLYMKNDENIESPETPLLSGFEDL